MKKGIELSVNFMVVFIIALIIFFFGIKFIYDIIGIGQEQEEFLSQNVIAELERLALQGERVSIAFNQETIPPGKQHLFGLGILNTDANKKYFAIWVEQGPAYNIDNQLINNGIEAVYPRELTIELDEHKKVGIMVKVPRVTTPGSYILNVYVCHADEPISECGEANHEYNHDDDHDEHGEFYDEDNPVRKIYVEVP